MSSPEIPESESLNALALALEHYRDPSGELQQPGITSASECLENALARLGVSLQQADVEIQVPPLPDIVCHPAALVRVFQNLIGNALKYRSDRQPEIYVSAHRDREFWTFAVTDNGIGFPAARAESIFGLLGQTGGKSHGGAGLGLCRRLLEHYGGTIWAESSVGYGSTFFFSLPAYTASAATSTDSGIALECPPF